MAVVPEKLLLAALPMFAVGVKVSDNTLPPSKSSTATVTGENDGWFQLATFTYSV